MLNLSDAAEKIGFRTVGVKANASQLNKEVPLPCIIHWNNDHFVVLYRISKEVYYLSDPAKGLRKVSKTKLVKSWAGVSTEYGEEPLGIALLLEPTPKFYNSEWEAEKRFGFGFIYRYLSRYKRLFFQLIIGLIAGSLLQLIIPFLTQSVVDVGIQNQDIPFIYLVLLAQLMIFIGGLTIQVIRSWILLHISSRVNLSLVSDFFVKLMNLPIGFFDSKVTGDLLQRINDHKRIETFLTSTSLSTLFSFVNVLIFGSVLLIYNIQIFLLFGFGSALYIIWVLFFLKRRKEIDYLRFDSIAAQQSKVIEIINGMQEIRLHNSERKKRWQWEFLQIRLYRISIKSLKLEQLQGIGSTFIDQLKNLLITITSATLVVDGSLTLGMMLSIQYIIGQLNSPIGQVVGFVRSLQDAKISLERLGEIHDKDDEDQNSDIITKNVSLDYPISFKDLSFRYKGSDNFVLKNLNGSILNNKVNAIVGTSGSGKTTLMKLLLKFYEPTDGIIQIGYENLENIDSRSWRSMCGVVMQDGYIFNDTIAQNIAIGEENIDKKRLKESVSIANIKDFIESLPLSYNTIIGNEGIGISAGQKQRLLLARAIYKDPKKVFLDEATSHLDSENEKQIHDSLQSFFKERTVLIIAHRLSTIRNADQIIVIDKGEIKEIGKHEDLIEMQGIYYNLVKNQLQL